MKLKNIITIIFLIISAVIGAGFASGEEIAVFFGAFSIKTFINILLFAVFFFFCCYFFLSITSNEKLCLKLNKSKINKTYHIFSIVVLILMSATMLSMVGQLCDKIVFISPLVFKIIFLGVAISIAFVGFDTFSDINGAIGKNLFFAILIALIYLLFSNIAPDKVTPSLQNGSFLKTCLYVALNVFLIIELLTKSGKNLTKKQRLVIASVSASCLAFLILLMSIIIKIKGANQDIGLMFSLMKSNKVFAIIYAVILIVAAFTSLVTALNAIKEKGDRLLYKTKSRNYILGVILVLIFIISFINFSSLVKYLYPVEAILCLAYISYLLTLQLFGNPFFKRIYSKIHKGSKYAKDKSACHN